jgi:hypothetical protein
MKCYVFQGSTGSGRAITDDRTGAKLPKRDFGKWVFEKEIETDHSLIGGSPQEIEDGIKRDGYLLWPQKKPQAPRVFSV